MNLTLIFCSLLYLFNVTFLCAQTFEIDSLIHFGIKQSICQNYVDAESTFKKIIKIDRDQPRGYFFMAAAIQSKSMDYETALWEKLFLSYLDKTEQTANEFLVKNEKDVWANFYLGSALSYRAFFEGRKKKFVPAISHGLSGIGYLKKVIELDSTMYDAYFGIGSYKYWRSKLTRYLNWLPLISDERNTGIEMVKIAATKGHYTNAAAINGLVWILIDHGQVSEALKWAKVGLQQYPDSRFFLWGIAKSYYMLNQFNNALKYYEIILSSILTEEFNNHYNETICYYKIAQCYYHLKQHDEALAFCEKALTIKSKPKVKNRLKEIYKKTRELKKDILEK